MHSAATTEFDPDAMGLFIFSAVESKKLRMRAVNFFFWIIHSVRGDDLAIIAAATTTHPRHTRVTKFSFLSWPSFPGACGGVVFGGRHRPAPTYKVMMISRARRGMSEVVRIEGTTTKKNYQ